MWFLTDSGGLQVWHEKTSQMPLIFEVGTRVYLWGWLMGGGV